MRKNYTITVEIPTGISCHLTGKTLHCSKDEAVLERTFHVAGTALTQHDSSITFTCPRSNKKHIAMIHAAVKHVKNMLKGLDEKYVYRLEVCHVHFPMTVKVEGSRLEIKNFLGEKTPRYAKILPDVDVAIKGNEITVSGHDIEKAGQTAANIEKAAKVPKKDRRVFQDGIFITEKPGGSI